MNLIYGKLLNNLKPTYTCLTPNCRCKPDPLISLKRIFLPLWFWFIAHFLQTPGLFVHRYAVQTAIKLWLRGRLQRESRNRIFVFPMDSVRYFEFDFIWKSIIRKPLGVYLDLSSPRLLPVLLLEKMPETIAVLVNPDGNDLKITHDLIGTLGFENRCTFIKAVAEDLDFPNEAFETITSISVIEHIPDNGDLQAVAKLWKMLKQGGRLYLTVPCASEATEEYIDFNEYGLLVPNEDNYIFGQRFYDQDLLNERIFAVTGKPIRMAIYGEKKHGIFIHNREEKFSNPFYPYWREPYMMGKDYCYYQSIADLPGLGVVAMQFEKS